ncbi:hypothetical protein [Arthrobacter bussei]|uniref:Uncharacterized protein n=1 Tax=Arthrobacter bussei TaxID=2594179 RepID=A0A7X1NQ98_9MICC|nr:hypothetical protein [Arthrobacter bussei]MPY11039.1 hypothetical protein [Arthrobacter bussei]
MIAGFAVLLTIPIIVRLADGAGNGLDWVFLVMGIGLAGYWVLLALRGRRARRAELDELRRLRDGGTVRLPATRD